MNELPLHPGVVHIPLALAIVLPIISVLFLYLFKKGKVQRLTWAFVITLHILLTSGALGSIKTGELDEDKVKQVVTKEIIHEHEEKAETFMAATVVALIFSLITMFTKTVKHFRVAAHTTVGVQIVVLGLALIVGHSGGELIYKHGAASAHVDSEANTSPEE